ncbi:MAG: ABC transporter permease [Albidovulum sp.]|nr:ABC transporter permease [Albidovulum sp.]MDE0529976.1 ABC transporter permease [Albidovulum sp.]
MPAKSPTGRWELALAIFLVGVIVLNSFLSPYFLDFYNLIDSTFSFSEKALIALPMAFLIIAREIDVSVASIVALSAVLMGVAADAGAGTPLLVLVGLLSGTLAGTANGVIVSVLGVHSIVVTIGTLSLYRGIVVLIAGDEAFTGFPTSFAWFGQHYLGGYVPVEFLVYIIATVIFGILLHLTTFGRKVFALGTNPAAAAYSGVPHTQFRVVLFAITGFMCGLAAVLLTSRLGSVRLNVATGWELQVITMVVLGGVSISGGTGSIFGVTLAVFLIGLLTFGLSLINVPGIVMNIYIGLMLVSAIALPKLYDTLRSRFFSNK